MACKLHTNAMYALSSVYCIQKRNKKKIHKGNLQVIPKVPIVYNMHKNRKWALSSLYLEALADLVSTLYPIYDVCWVGGGDRLVGIEFIWKNYLGM